MLTDIDGLTPQQRYYERNRERIIERQQARNRRRRDAYAEAQKAKRAALPENAPIDAVCDHCPLIDPCRVSLGTLTPAGPDPLPCQPESARFAEWKAWRKGQPGYLPGMVAVSCD